MRTMFFYNINMYKKTHNIDVKDDELNICIYLIPDEGIGKKYYEEKYVYSSIKGYNRFTLNDFSFINFVYRTCSFI